MLELGLLNEKRISTLFGTLLDFVSKEIFEFLLITSVTTVKLGSF